MALIYRVQDRQQGVEIAIVQLWLGALKRYYGVIPIVEWFTFILWSTMIDGRMRAANRMRLSEQRGAFTACREQPITSLSDGHDFDVN